jgi:hypothetical protein
MKLIFAALMMCSAVAMASEEAASSLRAGDLRIYKAKVSLGGVGMRMPKCPPNAMCEPQAFASLVVHLGGCLDRLGQSSANVTLAEDGKYYVNVSATGIATKRSQSVRCIAAPTAQIQVDLPGFMMTDKEVILNDLSGR